jgi:hypothetical protein
LSRACAEVMAKSERRICGMNERMVGEGCKRSNGQSDIARRLVSSRKLHGTTGATDVRRTCVADRLSRER